jgi:hypothetical protein
MAADVGDFVQHAGAGAMAALMPGAVPTVIALAGTADAAATMAEATVRERRTLRIELPPGL